MARPLADPANLAIGLRVPADLKERLIASAKANDRPLSQEIIRRLRLSLECESAEFPNGTSRQATASRYGRNKGAQP